ncbi:MAG: hypothetical protein LAQ69_20815 [Acidobacteriia bacterium]|nr:hypothetical protein [Terriglobia bacterium]
MLQNAFDPTTNPLNNNEWAFPLFECIHIAMFAMSVGTIAIVDFRMLGLAMRRQTVCQLLKGTWLWTTAGLVIAIASGLVIFTTDPLRYYYNWSFRYKCIALTLAVIYNYTIHRKVALSNPSPFVGGLVAGVSLLLWISIVFAGLFYAFT